MNLGQLVLEVERVCKDNEVISYAKSNGEEIMPSELLEVLQEVGAK